MTFIFILSQKIFIHIHTILKGLPASHLLLRHFQMKLRPETQSVCGGSEENIKFWKSFLSLKPRTIFWTLFYTLHLTQNRMVKNGTKHLSLPTYSRKSKYIVKFPVSGTGCSKKSAK
jgi:hypothetical protein